MIRPAAIVRCVQCCLGAVLLSTPAAFAGTLNWSASGAALTRADGTTLAPTGSLVRLGYFTVDDTSVTNGAADPVSLSASFIELQAAAVGDNTPGSPGLWGKTFNGDFTATYSNFAGRTVYLWTFDAASIGAATQQGIIKFTATFPTDLPAPTELSLDLSNALAGAGSILVGAAGAGNIATALGPLPFAKMAVIPIGPGAPVAGFSGSPTNGVAPLGVVFTDASTGTITNRQWTFGDGGTSGAANPSHTYSNAGSYTVTLTVAGPGGSNTLARNSYVVVGASTNRAPEFVLGPVVTNALLQVDGLAVVLADAPAVFLAMATDPDGDAVSYRWSLGDGTTALGPLAGNTYSDCQPYAVNVTASDGLLSNTAPLTVTVPCVFSLDKLQVKVSFAKPDKDGVKLQGAVELDPAFNPAGQVVVLDVGGATVAFALDEKGKGVDVLGKLQLKYSAKTTNWVVKASLKGGNWAAAWADDGLANAPVEKPGNAVTLPVIVVVGENAFMQERVLIYTAKQDKSGKAK